MNRALSILTATAVLMVASTVSAEPARSSASAASAEADLIRAHAAAPMDRVRFMRPIHGYEVVGNQAVLVWETPFKAWLVDLRPSAACRDLDQTWRVGVDTMSDTMNTRNSYIVGEHNLRCKISQISEVDVRAWRLAKRTE